MTTYIESNFSYSLIYQNEMQRELSLFPKELFSGPSTSTSSSLSYTHP